MEGYIKIEDIKKYCDDGVKMLDEMIDKVLEKNGPISNVSAVAFFMQQRNIYKHDIPSMVDELKIEVCSDNISTLELPRQISNLLIRSGIKTVDELSSKTITELEKIRGLGPQGLHVLLAKLGEHGIYLKN